jgi:hypothetical protein
MLAVLEGTSRALTRQELGLTRRVQLSLHWLYGPVRTLASFRINIQASLKIPNYLTAWSIVLPEKLTGSQQVKKFPEFYGTRRFIIAFTTARHLFLPSA